MTLRGGHILCALMLTASAAEAVDATSDDPVLAVSEQDRSLLVGLITSTCIDVHPLDGCEVVALLQNTDDLQATDLIVLANVASGHTDGPLLMASKASYIGTGDGGAPFIGDAHRLDFIVNSKETDIGRRPWFNELRIGWRDDKFVVAGQTLSSYDRATGQSFYCAVNLEFGSYLITVDDPEATPQTIWEQAGESVFDPISLDTEWAYLGLPSVCDEAANVYYN